MAERNYHEILSVSPSATLDEIKQAYRTVVSMIHPDRFDPVTQPKQWSKANDMLRQLSEAYSILSDPHKRSEYDSSLLSELMHLQHDRQNHLRQGLPSVHSVAETSFPQKWFVRFVEPTLRTICWLHAPDVESRIPELPRFVPAVAAV
jgi:curved DNA-binding protein CbpA